MQEEGQEIHYAASAHIEIENLSMVDRLRKPVKSSPDASSEEVVSKNNNSEVESFVSSALDVYKGFFIFFMLTEHTRSSFRVSHEWSTHPIMHVISQVACALDMTSFSTAYGFSCQRLYYTNDVKQRSLSSRIERALRSVGVILFAAFASNITFEWCVTGIAPNWDSLSMLLLQSRQYWDFLGTFPLMLGIGFLTTKPLLDRSRELSHVRKLFIYLGLLVVPLAGAAFNLDTCESLSERYAALFIGCVRRSMGAMRFSAISYMFYFNWGAVASEILRDWVNGGLTLSTKRMYSATFAALLAIEIYCCIPLFKNWGKSWEYLNWEGYMRFPMSPKLVLAWGFLTFSALSLAVILVYLRSILINRFALIRVPINWLVAQLEHMGANVLLYLLISNLTINGFFANNWTKKVKVPDLRNPGYSNRTWEWLTVTTGLSTIVLVRFVIYLVRSGRK